MPALECTGVMEGGTAQEIANLALAAARSESGRYTPAKQLRQKLSG